MNKEQYKRLLLMRKNEEEMFKALIQIYRENFKKTPRNVINEFPINHKRAWYLLDKWSKNGDYDWGVNLDLGWIERKRKFQ